MADMETDEMVEQGSSGCETSTQPTTNKKPQLEKKPLTYEIHQCSSTSNNYTPENILVDKPGDQQSRWSSDTNTLPQFLVLKLSKSPAVVTSVTFGKYEKTHVCNLKRFKILGGLTQDEGNMIPLIDSGLRNDSQPETFPLRHRVNGQYFPCQYIKILPIQSWGPSFNFSIWYVALNGDDNSSVVQPAIEWHRTFREEEAIRLCLKHFRQKNYTHVFDSLLKGSNVQLEDPRLTKLHEAIVVQGDYELTENLIESAIQEGLFEEYINSQHPSPQWTALISPDEDSSGAVDFLSHHQGNHTGSGSSTESTASQTPLSEMQQMGHPAGGMLPLVGGVGGAQPLAEAGPNVSLEVAALAAAALQQEQMQLDQNEPQLSVNHQINLGGVVHDPRVPPPQPSITSQQQPSSKHHSNASDPHPGSRGGHQMVLDSSSQMIYLFGGWDGTKDLSDLWSYNISDSKWKLISPDTSADGGPSQRSCHKMVIDTVNKHIFTLGRYLERSRRDDNENIKSDFYMYDIVGGKWTLITDDTSAMGGPNLIFDHQMCMDQARRTIYVFGGQSLYSSSSSSSATTLSPSTGSSGGNEDNSPSQVTSRTTTGGSTGSPKYYSGLYEYHVPTNTWKKLREDSGLQLGPSSTQPDPGNQRTLKSRSSHSMLFHPGLRKLFIFGGQRKQDEYLSDFFTYNVDTDEVENITNINYGGGGGRGSGSDATAGGSNAAIPAAGYTQRATIDCQRSEIHVMTGLNFRLNKDPKEAALKSQEDPRVTNSFWVYSIPNNRWTCFYRYDAAAASSSGRAEQNGLFSAAGSQQAGGGGGHKSAVSSAAEPKPRYAHQLVYDDQNRVHYMFGGNPGGKQGKEDKLRLGDFWRLQLMRPDQKEIFRRCCLMIRRSKFLEMTSTGGSPSLPPSDALVFLQSRLSEVVNHADEEEERSYQALASHLFASHLMLGFGTGCPSASPKSEDLHPLRNELFENLAAYFPPHMTHPKGNLIDLIPPQLISQY